MTTRSCFGRWGLWSREASVGPNLRFSVPPLCALCLSGESGQETLNHRGHRAHGGCTEELQIRSPHELVRVLNQLLVDVIQPFKPPAIPRALKRIDDDFVACAVLARDGEFPGPSRICFPPRINKAFCRAALVIEDIAIAPSELRSIPQFRHPVGH
jgi:hypothetical protein